MTQSFQVTGGATPQTIHFPAPPGELIGNPPFPITATASSGLPVTFSSTNLAICTVSGNTVTITARGKCPIIAMQAGNGAYAPAAPVTR
ncbi:hypothetical protein ABTM96_19435, partial [Acinetobacter baumannii]